MRALIYSNLYIALAALLFTRQTCLLEKLPCSNALSIFVFGSTLFVYNLDRLSEAAEEDHTSRSERHRWIERHRGPLWGLASVGGLMALGTLPQLDRNVWWALVPLGAMSMAYALPLLPSTEGSYRLKEVAGSKTLWIACVWAGATGALPLLERSNPAIEIHHIVLIIERALYIFALTLPFELRDLDRDRRAGLETLPMRWGRRPTRWLACGLLGLFALLAICHYGGTYAPPLVLSAGLTVVAVARVHPDRHELYYVGLLDGMMILQWSLVAGWSRL